MAPKPTIDTRTGTVPFSAPLRRTRTDLTVMAAIATIAVLAVSIVYSGASIRNSELLLAEQAYAAPEPRSEIPKEFTEIGRLHSEQFPGADPATSPAQPPIVAAGLLITYDEHDGRHRVRAYAPESLTDGPQSSATRGAEIAQTTAPGEQKPHTEATPHWEYSREYPLCSIGSAWDSVVLTYRTAAGCGDVVALDAATGQYDATRSAVAPDVVGGVQSNDRVGIVSAQRVELWRSDLVRTVEYGSVEAPQEPNSQPNANCSIHSALTRTELLAVVEHCPDDPQHSVLRLQEATPEDSRVPEVNSSIGLDHPGAHVVAIGQDAAAVYLPGEQPELMSFNTDGTRTSQRRVVKAADLGNFTVPATADLPHHMTWFDGHRLYFFTPNELAVEHIIEAALGTGVAVEGKALVPTEFGISVVNWNNGEIERTIPLDRGDYRGPVSLAVAGEHIVEKRGTELVVLR